MTNATPSLSIEANERVCFVGKTGSGKTYLARLLLAQHSRVIVIDPKGTFGSEGFSRWNKKTRKLLRTLDEPFRIRIPAVIADKPEEAYEAIFQEVFESEGNILVYIDELYLVTSVNGGKYLRALYSQGRELDLSVWSATQRPSRVPLFTISESEWVFNFRLQLLNDRVRMSETMGNAARNGIPNSDKHGFYIYYQQWDKPLYCPSISIRK